jgi:hypothetical protein
MSIVKSLAKINIAQQPSELAQEVVEGGPSGNKRRATQPQLTPIAPAVTVQRPVAAGFAALVAATSQHNDIAAATRTKVAVESPEAQRERAIRDNFAQQFGELAQDEAKFHAMMKQVYGEGYDRTKAEDFRQKALKGDYSWLPKIQFVDASTLGGANGAYDKESGTVFLNKDLDADTLAQTFVEEAGHHLDTQLNKTDAQGDEGELFRRLLGGEKLSAADIHEIRSENDKGKITVNGKTIEVEFWNPFKAVAKAVKGAAKAVGKAVSGVAKGIGSVFTGVAKGVGSFFTGLYEGTTGFFGNLFRGKIGDAFGSLWKGLDKAFLRSTGQILNGVLTGVEEASMGVTELLGPFKKPVQALLARGLDATRSLVTGAWDIVRGAANNIVEGGGQFLGGLGKVLTGNFKEGFKDMGVGVLKVFVQTPVDALLLGLGRGVSAIQTLLGVEPVGRKLSDREIALLRKVYGDSIDYDQVRIKEGSAGLFSLNDRPFTHGNTIYMKDNTVTDELLVHEMGHVWQHQNGGTDYMSEALMSQWWGDGYDWEKSVPGTAWKDLQPEQQSEFLEKAFASGYFDGPGRTFVHNGVDYTDYLEEALRQVRAGEGAP